MNSIIAYIAAVSVMLICSVVMGRILFWIDGTAFVNRCSRRLMNVLPWDFEEIKSSFIGIWYYIVPLVFAAGLGIAFDFDPLQYLKIDLKYIGYIPLTIFAEMSIVTMMSGCLTLFSDRKDWSGEIGSISWIKSIQKRNKAVVRLVPILGALVEETFFRGTVFLILYTKFTDITAAAAGTEGGVSEAFGASEAFGGLWDIRAGFFAAMIVSALLFTLEQVLFTENREQRLSMILASLGISFVACTSVAYTGSFLPCLLAHECFLVFYFGRFRYY